MPDRHAVLSASKAHQWLKCPPSIRWSEQFPEPEQSEAAAEGVLAHSLAEDHMRKTLDGKRLTVPAKIKNHPLYKPAMVEHVAAYCDTIMETITQMREENADPIIYLEQELDLSPWVPEGFGTADCVVIGNGVLHVFDFKYGKGIPVTAEENPQLSLYGLGALNEFGMLYDIDLVTLHIIQPRLDSITEWTIARDQLELWGEEIKPIAKLAFAGAGEYNPGEDQCRWCVCKNVCRAYNSYILDAAKARFNDLGEERQPNELTPKEIAELLKVVDEIKRWATRVADYALDQALTNGTKYPGFKLVEGISRRKITDEKEATDALVVAGFQPIQIMKLKGLGDLEELVGKKRLNELIGDYVIKPPGKPTLVPVDDKRPEYNEGKNVFQEIKEEIEK
jgi:hypothetical protein